MMPAPPVPGQVRALTLVDRQTRAEALKYLEFEISFDFRDDFEAIKTSCKEPESRQQTRYMSLQVIESIA